MASSSSAPPSSSQSVQLTEFAQKYGVLPNSHKSGLTPLPYLLPRVHPRDAQAEQAYQDRRRYQKLQKRKFRRFTSRELADLDAITPRDLPQCTLANGILPIFQKDRWEKMPLTASFDRTELYDMPDGNGKWEMGNPVVEALLTPILKLASRMLASEHVLPWFDAIISGERRPIPEFRIPDRHKGTSNAKDLKSFHARVNTDTASIIARRDQVLDKLVKKWNFTLGFAAAHEDPRGPTYFGWDDCVGFTVCNNREMKAEPPIANATWGIWVFFGSEMLAGLLRKDLNMGERMGIELDVASTIVHETMHAIKFLLPLDQDSPQSEEEYFEDDAMAEVGYAFEKAVNGGITPRFLNESSSTRLPLGYWLSPVWPNLSQWGSAEGTIKLINPGLHDTIVSYPIPVSVYSDAQQENFWDVGIRTFGHALIHYRTLREACSITFTIQPTKSNSLKSGSESESEDEAPILLQKKIRITGKGDRVAEIEAEAQKRRQADVLEWAALPPETREIVEFGNDIAVASQKEQQFWSRTQAQRQSVITMIERMETLAQQTEKRAMENALSLVVESLNDVGESHEFMIASLEAFSTRIKVKYEQRVRDLLAWNRGTRIFLRQIDRLVQPLDMPVAKRLIIDNDMKLELCRMRLWNPVTAMKDVPDFDEKAELDTAQIAIDANNHALARHLCDKLQGQEGLPIAIQIGVQIVYASSQLDTAAGWQIRYESLRQALVKLQYFHVGPKEWSEFLGKYEASAKNTLEQMRVKYGEP